MAVEQHLRVYDAALAMMAAKRSLVLKPEFLNDAIAAEGLSRQQLVDEAMELLRTSPEMLSPHEIEALLALCGDLTKSPEGVAVLNSLLRLSNHERHEDIARLLQCCRDPSSVQSLADTAQTHLDYLAWDEGKALARKCLSALAAIDTDEAWSEIARLSQVVDSVVASWAKHQLDQRKW